MTGKTVIVIGGGLGGLAAAVSLAQQDYSVTLYEQAPRLGGYAIAFEKQSRSADLALHAVAAGGAGQEFRNLVDSLGLNADVQFIKLSHAFNVRLGKYSFLMPNDYGCLFSELGDEFPFSRAGLHAFRVNLEKYAEIYSNIFHNDTNKLYSWPRFLMHISSFFKHANMPVRTYLQRFISDQRLMALLYQSSIFLGIPMDELPTISFMLMFRILFGESMYTIAGGGQALTNALERRLHQLDVNVITGTKVSKIQVKDHRVTGIVTDKGDVIPVSAVIAGVSIPQIVYKLVGQNHFSTTYLRNLSRLQPSLSVLAFNFWMDCHPSELGITDHITVAFPSEDIDACIKSQRNTTTIEGFSITAHVNTEPSLYSPDRAAVSVVGGTCAKTWLAMNEALYRAAKQKATQDILQKLNHLYPGFINQTTSSDLVTPRTLFHFTGNPNGAIMGFDGSCGMNRWILATSKLPIEGLEPAGAWTGRMGGMMQSMRAGLDAAMKINRKIREKH